MKVDYSYYYTGRSLDEVIHILKITELENYIISIRPLYLIRFVFALRLMHPQTVTFCP